MGSNGSRARLSCPSNALGARIRIGTDQDEKIKMKSSFFPLAQNVEEHIIKTSEEIGKIKASTFYDLCTSFLWEQDVTSPIEQILYCSIKHIQELNFISDAEPRLFNGKDVFAGLYIEPQKKIGNYKVDFSIYYFDIISLRHGKEPKIVIVECDSQEWHERTERERRYEKTRDRCLQKLGYKTFHYTGSEIVKNSTNIAIEILSYLTDTPEIDFLVQEYST